MSTNAFRMELKGIDELKARIHQMPDTLQTELQAKINSGAEAIAAEAKQRAPVNFGILKNLISNTKAQSSADGLTAVVVSAANYSAYVEFGTGTKVSVPPDLEEFAIQFKGTKIVKGMRAQPYFFPAAKRIFPLIEDDVQKTLDKL
jgi:HK97 gp10 family phage protein